MLASLTVLLAGREAARIDSDRHGKLTLSYRLDYAGQADAVPLSLSMPLREQPYTHDQTERWLIGLLPANDRVLSRWYQQENASPRTPFGLLGTPVGLDCAGAVQFCPAGEERRLSDRATSLTPLTNEELAAEVARMATDSARWLPDDEDAYYSLGGYQNKTALHWLDSGGWARPHGGTPTTHIIKPSPGGLPGMAVTEHLCQSAASALGLGAATTDLALFGPHPTAIVTRYDRTRTPDGGWQRVHQEDMCQALGGHPHRKFEWEGGPGASAIGDAIRRHSTDPDTDIRRFRDAILFAWATVNRDAHARNYSMLIAPGSIRLSPLYDLGSALPFTRKKIGEVELAMRVGDDHTVYRSDAADALLGFAARLRLPAAETLDAAEQVTATAPAAIRAAIESLPESTPLETAEQLAHRVQRRSENCLRAVTANRNRIVGTRRSGAPNGNDG